jgi:hypothetical protein
LWGGMARRRGETGRYHSPPEGRTASLLFPWRHRVTLFTRQEQGREVDLLSTVRTHAARCCCCLVWLLHVLHVSLMGNKPFARVQSYLPESATHHPNPVLGLALPALPLTAPLLVLHPLLPGRQRIGRRGVIDWSVPFWGKGGSSSNQSFRFPFETHHRARIHWSVSPSSTWPVPRDQSSPTVDCDLVETRQWCCYAERKRTVQRTQR